MDEFLDEMDCRYRSDSIMMKLLRSAMDKAYEKVQSKDGLIECLHERSKFYELAIIQIKGCHSLIQEETDSCIPESSREKMLMDLIELQDLLQARLKEMKTSIKEKDKELTERLKTEFKLKQALELKERELLRLRANIEIYRTKTDSFQDFIVNFEANNEDEAKEGEICDLKNSIDQQVLNIKQRLKKSTSNAVDYEFDNEEMLDEERFKYLGSNEDDLCNEDEYCLENKDLSPDSLSPEQNMVIQQMSSDIDILEGTLKIAFGRMQSAEVRPLEEQLRWTIEKETASILIKGFIHDLKQNFVDPSGLPNEHLMELIDEMTRLRGELETLGRNESMAKRGKGNDYSSDTRSLIVRTSSEPLPEFDYMEEQPEEDLAAEGSNYVAKLIKNHESFIKRQQKKLHSLKREGFGGKGGCSPAERDKEESKFTERRIREVVERLDSVTKWKDKLRAKIPTCPRDEKRRSGNVEKGKSRIYDKELIEERKKVKEERDESELQALAMEETYIVLCKGLMEDFNLELCSFDTESFIREEICFIICREAVKDFGTSKESALEEYRNFYLLSKLRDDICTIFTREMVGEFNKTMQSYASESLVNQEIYQEIYRIAFEETIKYIRSVAYLEISKQQDFTENVESLLKEDVYMVMFREMVGGLKIEKEGYEFENYIREDIYQFIIVAAVNEALNKDYGWKDLLSDKNLDKSSNASGEGSLNQQLDSILTSLGRTNIKEQISQHDLVILKREDLDECGSIELLREYEKSKELPRYLGCSLGIGFDNSEKEYDQINLSMDVVQEKEQSLAKPENNQLVQICSLPIIRFQDLLVDFKNMVQEKLQRNHLRLEKVKQMIDPIFQVVTLLRKRELLYKEAFVSRCNNLRLAENEVDLLGDQVDVLLGLLHKIYLILDQYSPVLSHYFEVSDILKLIKEEVNGGNM